MSATSAGRSHVDSLIACPLLSPKKLVTLCLQKSAPLSCALARHPERKLKLAEVCLATTDFGLSTPTRRNASEAHRWRNHSSGRSLEGQWSKQGPPWEVRTGPRATVDLKAGKLTTKALTKTSQASSWLVASGAQKWDRCCMLSLGGQRVLTTCFMAPGHSTPLKRGHVSFKKAWYKQLRQHLEIYLLRADGYRRRQAVGMWDAGLLCFASG